jgi:hypothetical protein
LRNGRLQAQKLSGIHPRMDFERTTWELTRPLTTTKGVSVHPALRVGKKPSMWCCFPCCDPAVYGPR